MRTQRRLNKTPSIINGLERIISSLTPVPTPETLWSWVDLEEDDCDREKVHGPWAHGHVRSWRCRKGPRVQLVRAARPVGIFATAAAGAVLVL